MKKAELLLPAGNFDKFEIAINYGADSVYLGGKKYGMRVMAGNLDDDEIRKAVAIAHSAGKKVYVTVNLFARDEDFEGLEEYLQFLQDIDVDALIVADPGIIAFAKKAASSMAIHLSTQSNTLNSYAANYWHDMGVKRIVLARELSLKQIENIRKAVPASLELEMFAHGSMCMAYSGRCAISAYLTGREANQGFCTQPCRWEFSLTESKRDGEVFHVEEEEGSGMFFFNSKDLNMLAYLKDLLDTGIDSLKIEGRMKSEHYVAAVGTAYRTEIDRYYSEKEYNGPLDESMQQLDKVTYRPYTTGFNYGNPHMEGQSAKKSEYVSKWDYIGKVLEAAENESTAWIREFNPFSVGDEVEILDTEGKSFLVRILSIKDEDGSEMEIANHPKQKLHVEFNKPVSKLAILRKNTENRLET
ncbi:MAG: U32 family peptidase [Clostridia bacterium]|nr:U32 family peptidase [Clostridia bacterium]